MRPPPACAGTTLTSLDRNGESYQVNGVVKKVNPTAVLEPLQTPLRSTAHGSFQQGDEGTGPPQHNHDWDEFDRHGATVAT